MNVIKKTVYVAMSGGVDSSVAAALLKKEGHDVVGVFFKPWSPDRANNKSQILNPKQIPNSKFQILNSCSWQEDRQMAMRVASKLGIKFKTWDFSKEYGKEVVEYMVDGYKKGLTPNPDVMCNKEIKFGLFLKKALSEGADYISTGHYVRLRRENYKLQTTNPEKASGPRGFTGYKLLVGIDKNKDQSYFLWTLTQEQLKYCLFPIGDYAKPEVRKLAKKFGLPNYDKKDSQGICFVGKMDVKDFLKTKIKPKVGKIIIASTGEEVGRHDGAYYYTIGQRHGLNIGIGGGPYFVVSKDMKKNIIYVDEKHLLNRSFTVGGVNWLHEPDGKLPFSTKVKIRYRNNSIPAKVISGGPHGTVGVELSKSVAAITPGQSAVFYRGQKMLGGGIVK